MEITLQGNSRAREQFTQATLAKGIGLGLLGGFAGTLVMDLVLMGALAVTGLPALTCFSIVGNTVAHLFALLGANFAGGVPMGIATHYLVGPLFGVIFGCLLVKVDAPQVDTNKKGIILAILYVEILSQPILAATPILLKMTATDTVKWFGASFVMHFLYGVVLGTIVCPGLRLANKRNHFWRNTQ